MILKYIGRSSLLILGLVILAVSLVKASLSIAQENNEEVKNNEISFTMTNQYGDKETAKYKLPEAGMLPDSMFYGFKKIRDYLWLSFSSGMGKPEMSLLMADKKVTEYRELTKLGKNQLAIEAGIEAVDKLKYANGLTSNIKPQNDQTKLLQQQILRAGIAYREIFRQSEGGFDVDQVAYSKLISTIDDWNKEQEKNRFEWDH